MRALSVGWILICGLWGQHASALGVFEPYGSGLSDFEFYSALNGGSDPAYSAVLGVGGGRALNLSLSPGWSRDEDGARATLTVGNGSVLYQDGIEADLLSSYTLGASQSAALGLELKTHLGSFTPYVQGSENFSFGDGSGISTSLALGTAYRGFERVALYAQVSPALTSASTTGVDLGVNIKARGNFELITQGGYSDSAHFLVGGIYTLE